MTEPRASTSLPNAVAAAVAAFESLVQQQQVVDTEHECMQCGRTGLVGTSGAADKKRKASQTGHMSSWDSNSVKLVGLWKLDAAARSVALVDVQWHCSRCQLLANTPALLEILASNTASVDGDLATPLAHHYALLSKSDGSRNVLVLQQELQQAISASHANRILYRSGPVTPFFFLF